MNNLNMNKKMMIPILILVISLIIMFAGSVIQLQVTTSFSEQALLASERVSSMSVRKSEYIEWLMDLRDSMDNCSAFIGETDATKSEYAQWRNSDEIKNLDNEEIQKLLADFDPINLAMHECAITTMEYVSHLDADRARLYYRNDVSDLVDQALASLDALQVAFEQDRIEATENLKVAERNSNIILLAVLILTSVVGVLFAFFIVRQISKQLTQTTDSLSNTANMVASASVQLADAGYQLSQGSAEQAASIEETSTTMDQTSSMVGQNAEYTKKANALSNEASVAAIEGSEKMKDMNDTMDELKESSANIAKIIKVIDEIAFQTNMLALNAAVEAARAGDAGQGFAVVAEEVRNLAQKSAKAAKETSIIIDKNIELSDHGVIISDEVGYALDDITDKINNINKIMSEIAVASEEQSKGTEQVTVVIGEMEKVVQSNAATAEQSAAAASALKDQSIALTEVVGELTKLVNGAKGQNKNKNSHAKLSKPKRQTLSLKDNKKGKNIKIVSPDDVIPLSDEDDF